MQPQARPQPASDPIPDPDTCHHLMTAMGMLPHIADHSRQVCRVAEFLTDGLIKAGVSLDRHLITAAALLHDITKTRSLNSGENHAATGGAYLAKRGYLRVSEIVRQHVALDHYSPERVPDEALIVNYADKRVLHDAITDLDARMTYIRERYGSTDAHLKRIDTLWQATIELEARLFAHLPYGPEQLVAEMDAHP
jgi:putative nucleotidyltransferase with HDIG domain